jgi:hypothetical protein
MSAWLMQPLPACTGPLPVSCRYAHEVTFVIREGMRRGREDARASEMQPDTLDRGRLGRAGRQCAADVGEHGEATHPVPSSPVEHEHDVHVLSERGGVAVQDGLHGRGRDLGQLAESGLGPGAAIQCVTGWPCGDVGRSGPRRSSDTVRTAFGRCRQAGPGSHAYAALWDSLYSITAVWKWSLLFVPLRRSVTCNY